MIHTALHHMRRNSIAYVALFFAVGGGGVGAAIAETAASTTIHACVSRKTGELFIEKRCGKTTKALTFNQRGPVGATGATGAAGSPAVAAFGEVGNVGTIVAAEGMTITPESPGVDQVSITAPACLNNTINVPVVSPLGTNNSQGTPNGIPVAWIDFPSQGPGENFTVISGDIVNGSFEAGNQGFDIQDQCT